MHLAFTSSFDAINITDILGKHTWFSGYSWTRTQRTIIRCIFNTKNTKKKVNNGNSKL